MFIVSIFAKSLSVVHRLRQTVCYTTGNRNCLRQFRGTRPRMVIDANTITCKLVANQTVINIALNEVIVLSIKYHDCDILL